MASTTHADAVPPPPKIIDDKSPHCIPFILHLLDAHSSTTHPSKPFTIGLNGIQGAGKTTLVSSLAQTLRTHGHPTLVLSIDDLYLTHADQMHLARTNASNALLQHRGEPGTHDMALAGTVFGKLMRSEEVRVPVYNKSAFNGQGDRLPESEWAVVNKPGEASIKVIIFEGWCVGFRSLSSSTLAARYALPSKTLSQHPFAHLEFVNEKLAGYDVLTDAFDAFIHIDAQETEYVYAWRQEQEGALRRLRGEGGAMTEEQVVKFVDGYYPAYELYEEGVREGVFKGTERADGRQLRLVVGRDRKVREVIEI